MDLVLQNESLPGLISLNMNFTNLYKLIREIHV
jgi:hypothetical protein